MAARRIPPAASAARWSELLEEIDGLAPAQRFEVDLTGESSHALRASRARDLVRRGYSLPPTDAADRTVLVPRPAGVLHVVSADDADDVPTWITRVQPGHFRQHVVAVDASEKAFASLSSACAGESWHLDSFLPRREWAEFMVEFIGSREIDLVQIVMARPAVDLVPTLRASYPFIRIVVDVAGSGGRDEVWSTYVTVRYGNVIDAFCTGQPDVAASLQRARVPASRIHVAEGGRERDEAIAALHEDVYGRLVAARVNERER
jgi:hypothetical protein